MGAFVPGNEKHLNNGVYLKDRRCQALCPRLWLVTKAFTSESWVLEMSEMGGDPRNIGEGQVGRQADGLQTNGWWSQLQVLTLWL